MNSIKWHKMLVEAIKTENALKQVDLVNNEREIKTLEAKLKILKDRSKEVLEIINKNEIEIEKINSEISKEKEKVCKEKTNTHDKEKSLSIGDSSQHEHPHATHSDTHEDEDDFYAEDQEALDCLNQHDGSSYWETMDSDLEDEIIHRWENW